jgi:hypothetical protein
MRRARSLESNSPGEHKHPRLVAHNSDVSLAGGGILYTKHVTWMEPSRLTISRGDRKDTTQDDSKLSRGGRMVETGLEVMSAPGGVESSEENARGRNVASDIYRLELPVARSSFHGARLLRPENACPPPGCNRAARK